MNFSKVNKIVMSLVIAAIIYNWSGHWYVIGMAVCLLNWLCHGFAF